MSLAEFQEKYGATINQAVEMGLSEESQQILGSIIGPLERRGLETDEINEVLKEAITNPALGDE